MEILNPSALEAYEAASNIADAVTLPDPKQVEAEVKDIVARTETVRVTLDALSARSKAQAELDKLNEVLIAATSPPKPVEIIEANVPTRYLTAPVTPPVVTTVVVMSVLGLIAWAVA